MNIVIINHYAGGIPWGMEFRPYYLAKEWVKKGHNVMIIGASFSHVRTKQPFVTGNITIERIEEIEYVWIKTNSYKGNGIGRLASILTFVIKLFIYKKPIFRNFAPDLVIASSTYPLDNYPASWIAGKFKALSCYEVHDLWPLSPKELGGYSNYHPFIIIMQLAENFAYKNADFVISMLPKTLEHMVDHGLEPEKFCYIPNGIPSEEYHSGVLPPAVDSVIDDLKKQNKCIVGYVGGHALSNALDILVDAASLAVKTAPQLAFVLIGDGAEKKTLIERASQYDLKNIFFLPAIPKPAVANVLSQMNILYLGWRDRPIYRFGISPNKLLDYMMAGRPVVHAVNAGNDMVADSGCGLSVKPEDARAIVHACIEISKLTPENQRNIGKLGREYVLKHNKYDVLAQKIIDFAQTALRRKETK